MIHSKYSYNGYTIDYSLISKEEVYSQGMNTLFAASVAMFIRNNNIADFNNLVIINSIKNNTDDTNLEDNHIKVAFQAFLHYELNDINMKNIILTELDMYDYTAPVFIDLITVYTILGFININNIFHHEDRVAFIFVNTPAKSFIRRVIEVAVENM